MYSMEMQFILTGSLNIISAADLGPVEVEVFLSSIFLLAGIFGVSGMTKPVIDYLPQIFSSFIPKTFLWNHAM